MGLRQSNSLSETTWGKADVSSSNLLFQANLIEGSLARGFERLSSQLPSANTPVFNGTQVKIKSLPARSPKSQEAEERREVKKASDE